MTPVRVGQRLGNYRLIQLLGKGGFAEVYLGEHIYLKNYAAVKILLTSFTDKEKQLFLSEAQTLARLTHPNIVQVREFAVERGIPFLAMDYAPGGTLRQRYPKGLSLSLEQTVAAVKQAAAALQYAHNHHIIHRDVKPENLLLNTQQHVQLSDFGIAVLSSSMEQERAGTLPYMAPEQWIGKACFASDQYSLGIVAYEWLSGVRPFEGPSLKEQHALTPPPSLREKDPSLPETVEVVVLKALAKNPKDRYVSVSLFAQALERASGTIPNPLSNTSTDTFSDDVQKPPISAPKRIFLSAALNDHAFATQLKTDIEQRDVTVESTLSQGESEEEQARRAIRAAQIVLFVISPHTRTSPVIKTHLSIAELYRRPVLYLWTAGDDLQELLPNAGVGKDKPLPLRVPTAPTQNAKVIDARPTNYRQALDAIITAVTREISPPVRQPLRREPDVEPRNPYKGLHAFTQEDATDFFGRETLVQEMVKLVENALMPASLLDQTGKRLLTVIGPSGSGKSSVVMAGLLPRLQQGVLPSSETWIYLDPIVPGQHPLDTLAYTLLSRFPGKSAQDLRETLSTDGPQALHQLATSLVRQPKSKAVLLIDQFEELFSSEVAEKERQQVTDLLMTAVTEPEGPLVVLLTLRADFYDRPLAYPALGRLIQQQQCTVLPMELEDLRATIEQPTTLPDVWLAFEDDLIGDLLFDIQGQVGALPLLQFTLDQLFEHRQGHHLTQKAYQEIGGVKGALSKHAETTYASLPSDEHRRLAKVLLLRLTNTNAAEQEPRRRRANLTEFTFENTTQTRQMQEIINAFLAARLLMTNQIAGVVTLEVSHETLLREWARLKEWMGDAREDMHLQQILSSDVAEWEKRGRPKNRLYPRSRLKEFKAWQERNLASKQEATFLNASMKRQTQVRVGALVVVLLVLSLLFPTIFYIRQLFAPSVTNLHDDGPGTLRAAISGTQPGGTITFDPNLKGAILLSTSLLITKSLTIDGLGTDVLAIKSGSPEGIQIVIFPGVTLHIAGMTFKDTKTHDFIINQGTLLLDHCLINGNTFTRLYGGIFNNGTLTLRNSTISHNTLITSNLGPLDVSSDSFGGGIYNIGGTVLLINSTISDNTVNAKQGNGAYGGGIANVGGRITLEHSTVRDNVVTGSHGTYGGGIYTQDKGTVTLSNSIVSGNRVTSHQDANGGGITAQDSLLKLDNSTIFGNVVTSTSVISKGGGIYIKGSFGGNGNTLISKSTITLDNSTISGNTIVNDKGVSQGGGIAVDGGQGTITSCTVYGNAIISTNSSGGGIRVSTNPVLQNDITFNNTIVANNHAVTGPDLSGGIITNGYNLIQDFSGVTFVDPLNLHRTDLSGAPFPTLGIDPQLKNNGGTTPTHALLRGSPAIDRIPLSACENTTDQRGVKRPQGPACDIGAYEYTPTKKS